MPATVVVQPSPPCDAELQLVGDKSISHRAFLINALGEGEGMVRGANDGDDVASTRAALRALGVQISQREGDYLVRGRGGKLRCASDAIDCGNSGTTMRLLAGIVAAQPFTTTLDGDASLRRRPMRRIAEPLRAMGARVEGPDNAETPPLIITGGELHDFEFRSPIASAQLKSCVLLAATCAGRSLKFEEPAASRDHSERMLEAMGADIDFGPGRVQLRPSRLRCIDVEVPADPSAAALYAAAILQIPGARMRVPKLLHSPSRDGSLRVLAAMGARVEWGPSSRVAGEDRADLILRAPDEWRGTRVPPEDIPSLLDEIPALAMLAPLLPAGEALEFSGIAELRVKESDRVAAIVELLGQAGLRAEARDDRLSVPGGQRSDAAELRPADDHRMAMAAIALGVGIAQRQGHEVRVQGVDSIAVSDPFYFARLEAAGVRIG